MDNIPNHRFIAIWRNPHLWYITIIMIACSIFYYMDTIIDFMGWLNPQWAIFYEPHDLHRLFFLIPVLYATYIFRARGVIVTALISMLVFLPYAMFISPYPQALLRAIIFFISVGIIGVLVCRLLDNITERKEAEEKLRESEEFNSSVLHNSPNPVLVANPDTSIRYVNPALEELTGYSLDELAGQKTPRPWWSEEMYEKLVHDANLAYSRGYKRFEQLFKKKNGERFWVEVTSTPIIINGESRHFIAAWIDITERKQAEEIIRREKALAEEYLNIAEVMLATIAADESIILLNKKGYEILGYQAGELIGKNWFDTLVPKRMRGEIRGVFRRLMAGDIAPVEHYENQLLTKDGEERLIVFHNTAIRDPGGQIVGVLLSAEDITERKQAEERESQLQQELALSSRLASIGELAAGVAHELNNPLTGIMGFSARLLRKSTDEEARRDLERVYHEAKRAAKVVTNLLTFARRREPKKEYLDVNDVMQAALELRAYELETGNIKVVTDLAPDLPRIIADQGQIQEVFLNIILNAEQAISESEGRGELVIKTREIKDRVRISFTNSGSTIPAEQMDKIFDPFFTTRGEKGGTGLGLSVCHGIVTEHGGRIYVNSKPGQGATFFVELPLTTEETDEG